MSTILYRPIVTEKMTELESRRQYAFEVDRDSNKIEIQKEIEKKFNVTVTNIRTINYKGKQKTQLTRRGRFQAKLHNGKRLLLRSKKATS